MNNFERHLDKIIICAFILIWFALSCFNRVSLDDWCLTNFVEGIGYRDFMVNFWQNYEGAFSSVTINFFIFKIIGHSHLFSVAFNTLVLSGFLAALAFFIDKILMFLGGMASKYFIVVITLVIFFAFYILQPQHKGVFFNYNWSTCYFLPITFFLLALTFLFESRKSGRVFGIFIFFILGAWKLHYSLVFIFILGSLYVTLIYLKRDRELLRGLVYSIAALLVSTAIYLAAPGNFSRSARLRNNGEQTDVMHNLMNTKLVNWFLFYKNIIFHPANLALVILLYVFFNSVEHNHKNKVIDFIIRNYLKIIGWCTCWIIAVTFFNGFFFEVIAGRISYNARVYVLMYFLVAVYLVFIVYLISLKFQAKFLTGNRYVSYLIVLVIFGYFIAKLPRAADYARAFDDRERLIKEEVLKHRNKDLYVHGLPDSGVFETGDYTSIGDSSMSFVNDCAKDYYKAEFNIYQIEKISYE